MSAFYTWLTSPFSGTLNATIFLEVVGLIVVVAVLWWVIMKHIDISVSAEV